MPYLNRTVTINGTDWLMSFREFRAIKSVYTYIHAESQRPGLSMTYELCVGRNVEFDDARIEAVVSDMTTYIKEMEGDRCTHPDCPRNRNERCDD